MYELLELDWKITSVSGRRKVGFSNFATPDCTRQGNIERLHEQ